MFYLVLIASAHFLIHQPKFVDWRDPSASTRPAVVVEQKGSLSTTIDCGGCRVPQFADEPNARIQLLMNSPNDRADPPEIEEIRKDYLSKVKSLRAKRDADLRRLEADQPAPAASATKLTQADKEKAAALEIRRREIHAKYEADRTVLDKEYADQRWRVMQQLHHPAGLLAPTPPLSPDPSTSPSTLPSTLPTTLPATMPTTAPASADGQG